jgi:uncharacterized protein
MNKVKITIGTITVTAEFNTTPTAEKIIAALPFSESVTRWGDEIYFTIPVSIDRESGARSDVEVGALGYWPVGSAFCIFFGPTPVTEDGKTPRAYSPVNVFGKVTGDVSLLQKVKDGEKIRVEKLS